MSDKTRQETVRFYEFGPFILDVVRCVLLRDEQPIQLNLKAFEILLLLIKNRGQVIEKDEIFRQVWHDTVVEENNLARNVSALRKALDEHPGEHQYIMTVPGHGYRFVSEVRELEDLSQSLQNQAKVDLIQSNNGNLDDGSNAIQAEDFSAQNAEKIPRKFIFWGAVLLGLLSVVTVIYFLSRHSAKTSEQTQPRKLWQLTFDNGLESEPTWSPDGRFLAYSSNRNGNFDIWVQPAGEGNAVRVTTNEAHDWQPDWAMEGNRLAFRSERDGGGIFVVPALGGEERKISNFGYRPRFSPDGSKVLFYSSILQTVVELPKVYVVGLDGNPPREVLSDFLTQFRSLRVAWHPDGKRISVWGHHREQGFSFWTVPLDGGTPVKSEIDAKVAAQLKESEVIFADFLWSSSGNSLYFEGVAKNVRNLWKIEVEPKSVRWTAGPERITTGATLDTSLSISADGKKLAYCSRTERTRIWSLPFESASGKTKGEPQPITTAGMNSIFPDVSPDGKKLAFVAQRAGHDELWMKSLANGNENRLKIADDWQFFRPRWSRDGNQLAYYRYRPPGNEYPQGERTIMLLSVIDGKEQNLTTPGLPVQTTWDWTADGKNLLGGSGQGTEQRSLVLYPLSAAPNAEKQMREITSRPEENVYQARYSPDSRWISFCSAKAVEAGISTIYVMPAEGGEWKKITEGKFFDDKPHWSPDGKTLYFISNRTGFFNVWGIRFNSAEGIPEGEPFRVTNFENPAQMILSDPRTLELSLTNNQLIFPMMEVTGDIWIIEDNR